MVELDWETIGYQDAKDWVRAATLTDWDYWNRSRNLHDRWNQSTIWVHGQFVRDGTAKGEFVSPGSARTFHERHREHIEFINKQDAEFFEWMEEEYNGISPVYDRGSAERDYGRGWMAHTTAVWEMICQKREEYEQKWHADHAAARCNRSAPEVPEQVLADIHRGR